MHYAFHLSRRARGMPLWFSLAVHGIAAYRHTLERILVLSAYLRTRIASHPRLELIKASGLSVILFTRHGWKIIIAGRSVACVTVLPWWSLLAGRGRP